MAWTVQLVDATSTVDLNDGTNTFLEPRGFRAPPPGRRMSMSGASFFRHGQDIVGRVYENRTVEVEFQLRGSAAGTLASKTQDIWKALRKATEYAQQGVGTIVQLKYQWEGADAPVFFNILEGVLDLGDDLHSQYLLRGTAIRNARLTLLCEPFAVGTTETISNYADDPSFEVGGSALADWVRVAGTGTTTRQTGSAKYGTAFARSVRTAGTAAEGLEQVRTSSAYTGSATWSVSVWYKLMTATSGMVARLMVEALNGLGTALGSATSTASATGTAWTQLTATAFDAPSTTGTMRYQITLNGGTGTGTVEWDGAAMVKAASLPQVWASGRRIYNHFDDNGQEHINYLDVYDARGDMPAGLQIKAAERESGWSELWVGARHHDKPEFRGLWVEGENWGNKATTVTGTAENSGSAFGNFDVTATSTGTPNIFSWPTGSGATGTQAIPDGIYRVLIRFGSGSGTGGTLSAAMGYSYAGVTRDPVSSSHYKDIASGPPFRGIFDIGILTMPPIETPASASGGTLSYRLAMHIATAAGSSRVGVDYVMLMPVDDGFVYGSKGTGQQVVLVDSMSRPQALALLSTIDVLQSIPSNQQGQAPELHPAGSRFYFLGQNTPSGSIGAGWDVTIIYQPRYLQVE